MILLSNRNPRLNSSINPRLNSSINPRLNSSINPRLNSSINPRLNNSYSGKYIFDLDNNAEAFIVPANDKIIQVFNFNLENIMFGVAHFKNGFALFDLENEFIGHLESDSKGGFNQFDLDNNWIASVK